MPAIQNALKKLRGSQPFNCVTTSLVHGSLRAVNLKSDFVVRHLHRVGTVRSSLPNGRTLSLWSRGDDWVSNQVYWKGWSGYEPESAPLFFRLASRSSVTFDVGAYVGYYTLIAAHGNPQGQVYAFEPMQAIYDRLQRNVELNRLANVECILGAVGDTEGSAQFFHTSTHLPTSSSLSFEFMRAAGDVISSTVPVITLDRHVKEKGIPKVDLLKIDTESTEPQVLRGMFQALRRDHPIILCEVLKGRGSQQALEEILGPLGYRYYMLTPHGAIQRDRIEGHDTWLNYLFTTLSHDELSRL
jgi:FkbM family methyltransferase